jgi:HEAT repeat protein
MPVRERRDAVRRLARTRSRHRDSARERIAHIHEDGDPAVIPALAMALELDPDPEVKRGAAYGLACIPDEGVVAPLLSALASPDRATVLHAVFAFGRMRTRAAVPGLVLLLRQRPLAVSAADALVEIGSEDALVPLRSASTDGPLSCRRRLRRRVRALEVRLGLTAPE